jgi:F0F1-type ATP synthase membrane subunit a
MNKLFLDITSPLDQFEIRDIFNLDILNLHLNITNIGLYLTIGTIIILTSSLLATNYNKIVSNK